MRLHNAMVAALIVIVLASTGVGAAETSPLPVTGQEVSGMESYDRLIVPFMEKWRLPGGTVAVVKDGRLVLARGYGWADVEAHEPVQPQSLFRIASVSKPFTSVTVLKLIEQGKLRLDDKLLSSLPNWTLPANADQRWREITLRQVLHHTGGWDRDKSFDPMFRSLKIAAAVRVPVPANSEAIIRYMMSQSLDFDPGQKYAYSNFGFCLLGRVIEVKTGTSYAEAVREMVLKPAGITQMQMGHTRLQERVRGEVRYYNQPANAFATSVFPTDRTLVPNPYGGFYLEAMDSHGAWIGSAVDLMRFVTALEGSRGERLLSGDGLAQMVARPDPPVSVGSATYYGLGWNVRPVRGGGENWWHGGSLPGTSTLVVRTAKGWSCAALFNSRHGGDDQPKGNFGGEFDSLLWKCATEVKEWPSHDLFETPAQPTTQSR